jgi:hypothetical protein
MCILTLGWRNGSASSIVSIHSGLTFCQAIARTRHRNEAKSNFGNGARKVEGRGFISYGTLLASYSQIHALYEIRVFDGKTFDIIEKMAAPPLDNVATVGLTGPSRLVDESFSPSTGDPIRNENLHGAITDLIARSLSSTLSDMHLAEVR